MFHIYVFYFLFYFFSLQDANFTLEGYHDATRYFKIHPTTGVVSVNDDLKTDSERFYYVSI